MKIPYRLGSPARLGLIQLALFFTVASAIAGNATWSANPASNDWNTAANWTPATVPNGATDTATFAVSNTTNVSLTTNTLLDSIVFAPDANGNPFVISVLGQGTAISTLTIGGAGVVNQSGITQQLTAGLAASGGAGNILLTGSATLGSSLTLTNKTGTKTGYALTTLTGKASAGSATIINEGSLDPAHRQPGDTTFEGNATAANATIICQSGAAVGFPGFGGTVRFTDQATAGAAIVTLEGSSTPVAASGGNALFYDGTSAGNGVFVLGGSIVPSGGGYIQFYVGATPGNATFIGNDGASDGGKIEFFENSSSSTARFQLFGRGTLTLDEVAAGNPTIGSVEGDGIISLSFRTLTIGNNSLSTTFAGTIDGTGTIVKIGTGTLTLSGASTYTGGTIVSGGALLVTNSSGSATGTGTIAVTAGTLGGSGTVSGSVSIGDGSGAAAFLAPAAGTKTQATLTIQGALTFNADSTYTYTFKAKGNKARTDSVLANGVAINSGATFNFSGQAQGTLRAGLTFTVLKNTSATPIAGTFSNLPDGAILTVNGNNFQASYEGGDGNDLTLTVQ